MPKPAISIRAKRVWRRLVEWYGTRLIEQFGEEPPADWCTTVDGIDNDAIERGMNLIRGKYALHPPTFPQFAEAMSPVREAATGHVQNIPERLAEYVAKNYWARLSPRQQRGPWNYFGRHFDAPDLTGKTIKDWGIEITGVDIPADGDSPRLCITVAHMNGMNGIP